LSASERESLLSKLSEGEKDTMWWDWQGFQARINQRMPKGDWTYWILLAGRGFGKTRTGAETVRTMVTEQGYRRIHLVASTAADVRDVMIQGESGLLSCFPAHQRPLYEPSKRLVTFHNGAIAVAFSADEPERLRGPQCDGFWADELAAWRFVQEAWDNLQFGFRLGARPRGIVSTTPKPIKLLKEILAAPDTVITRASSYENRLNLAPAFFKSIVRKYEGTRIGRQELLAELLEDVPGALWTRALIDATRLTLREVRWDLIVRIVVAVDPAVTHKEDSDESGIVVAGVTRSRHVIILDDLSCKGTVYEWARVTIAAYKSRQADRVVGEVNNGGDLVDANIRTADPNVAFQAVHASRGKRIRAEPVAALYEQGRVHHVGSFGILEDQMCGWTPQSTDGSPDRMDALVWAVTALVIDTPEETFRVEYGSDEEISQI
jgi:phage terminase large subunit-like protein